MKFSLGISNFLVEICSLSHSIVFLYFLHWSQAGNWIKMFKESNFSFSLLYKVIHISFKVSFTNTSSVTNESKREELKGAFQDHVMITFTRCCEFPVLPLINWNWAMKGTNLGNDLYWVSERLRKCNFRAENEKKILSGIFSKRYFEVLIESLSQYRIW